MFPVVIPPPLTISNSGALTPGTLGVQYSQSLNATGGVLPYTWSFVVGSGAIPTGLSTTSAGILSGTPTVAGTFSFTVRVTDSSGTVQTATKSLSLTIVSALAILTSSLPPGTAGTAYSTTLSPAGGTLPYIWAVTSGSLPAGLTLNSSTGVISGTPTAPTSSTVTDQAHRQPAAATRADDFEGVYDGCAPSANRYEHSRDPECRTTDPVNDVPAISVSSRAVRSAHTLI